MSSKVNKTSGHTVQTSRVVVPDLPMAASGVTFHAVCPYKGANVTVDVDEGYNYVTETAGSLPETLFAGLLPVSG